MASAPLDMAGIVSTLARCSSRPRYTLTLLQLLGEAADASGRAGPYVVRDKQTMPVRDWLCDAISPLGDRDPKRRELTARVREELGEQLPDDPTEAERLVEAEVRARVRAAGKANVSRAMSELVRAGLLRRHYQGYRTNHRNRGAGRQAVYTLDPEALAALRRVSHLV
jgi:DNA-binding transcriptional ArsR family regulator